MDSTSGYNEKEAVPFETASFFMVRLLSYLYFAGDKDSMVFSRTAVT